MTTWNERLETGHARVDAERRQFFDQLNTPKAAAEADAGRERVLDLISPLQTHAPGHFAPEEPHLAWVACTALHANRSAHRDFPQTRPRSQIFNRERPPVFVPREVRRESTGWIEARIINIDCRQRGCASNGTSNDTGW